MDLTDSSTIEIIKTALNGMNEKARRLFIADIAKSQGYGGISEVARVFNASRGMITRGIRQIATGDKYQIGDRIRKPGAGRPTVEEHFRRKMKEVALDGKYLPAVLDIYAVINDVIEKSVYGDPMTSHKWINITAKAIADEIFARTNILYGKTSIKKILNALGISLQKNQKYNQAGEPHPLRNEQYNHIQQAIKEYLESGNPVISIDTKCKEKLGDFIRPGLEYRRKGDPRRVLDHDFAFRFKKIYPEGSPLVPDELMGSPAVVIPYGIYCLNNNTGHVVLGISHDTSEFAADSISDWWYSQGKTAFPGAKQILILADGGGSNRSRGFLWKIALQQLADNLGLEIEVCHFAPGCSKHNPIEHRLWSQVSRNWEAKPLKNLEVVKGYVSHTTTATGLQVSCKINSKNYLTEKQKAECIEDGKSFSGITNIEMLQQHILIEMRMDDPILQKWNYRISPHEANERWVDYAMVS